MSNQTLPILSEAEEIAINSFAKNVGLQWGNFVSTALSEFLVLAVALRKAGNSHMSANPPRANELLTAGDVAAQLNVSRSKAYQLFQSGEIPCVRMGRTTRVRPADLQAYINKSTK